MNELSIYAAGLLFYVTVRGGGGWGAVGLCVGDRACRRRYGV